VLWYKKKYGLRVFESGGQGEIFGCKAIEVTGDWRKLIRSFMVFTREPMCCGCWRAGVGEVFGCKERGVAGEC